MPPRNRRESLRRDHEVKDNRLLPAGWTPTGPAGGVLPRYFLEATFPKGRAASDPVYRDGRGHAIVRYRIALPPGTDPRTTLALRRDRSAADESFPSDVAELQAYFAPVVPGQAVRAVPGAGLRVPI